MGSAWPEDAQGTLPPKPLAALERVDAQLNALINDAVSLRKAG
jgi:hypothetical protein